MKHRSRITRTIPAICALSLMLIGCAGGLRKTDIVKAPDAPMLITAVDGRRLTVSLYDSATNELIEYDERVTLDEQFKGWTLSKFNWEKLIREKTNGD